MLGRKVEAMQNIRSKGIAIAALATVVVCGTIMSSHQAAAAGGGPSVTIDGPLPLPVHDAPSQPFQVQVNCNPSTIGTCVTTVYTVPAGKRAVIEYASASAFVGVGHRLLVNVSTTVNSVAVRNLLPSTELNNAATDDVLQVGQQVKWYADPGTQISAFLSSSNPSTMNITLNGHLVNVP